MTSPSIRPAATGIVVARIEHARLALGNVPLVFFAGVFSTVSSR